MDSHIDRDLGPTHVKYRYLDASALVKLYIEEPYSDRVRGFVNGHPKPFQTTVLCFAEALNVLKRKWSKKQLNDAAYLNALHRLTVAAWGEEIQLQDYGLLNPFIHKDVAKLVEQYRIDASDVLQLLTIQRGLHSHIADESATVLITADTGLAKAARAEGIRVWNCVEGEAPDWA